MPSYRVVIYRTCVEAAEWIVEADGEEEAIEKAQCGDGRHLETEYFDADQPEEWHEVWGQPE